MKGWKLTEPFKLDFVDVEEKPENITGTSVKVKITKSLLSLSDYLIYSGENPVDNIVLGRNGVGVISENQSNLFGLSVGQHVYVAPYAPCLNCYNCKLEEYSKCSDVKLAGEDFDGFLRDFMSVEADKVFALPDSVSDTESLFISHISLAEAIINKLDIEKGDYVAVVGANNFGILLSQLLIYYQAVPMLFSDSEENCEKSKKAGIYYVYGPEENWQKEVSASTSGRMAKSVIYISSSGISTNKALSLASYGAKVAYTGFPRKNNAFSFLQAIKKQLDLVCINNDFENVATAINLIVNKAVDISHFNLDTVPYSDVPKTFSKMEAEFKEKSQVTSAIVDLI